MFFRKKDENNSIRSVVERNTGMSAEKLMNGAENPHLHNLKETAEMIRKYVAEHKEPYIIVVGDYDADGDTSTAIMYWMFRGLGITPRLRIPKRFSEGYGMSEKIIEEFPTRDGLIITVDNGISSYNAVKMAKEKGYTVIVTDHHLPPTDENGNLVLPPADIILDPHIEPEKSEFEDYCGAGIAYRLAQELLPGVNLVQLLVLASIGTVSDVMPLVGANRTLVKEGLKAINQQKCVPGLNRIISKLRLDHINEDDYGFTLGPIFNASGRLFDDGAMRVVEVLTSGASAPGIEEKADKLIDVNNVRKGLVREGVKLAETLVTSRRPIVIYHESFHEGIIGIIAGHLNEKYGCPVIVFTNAEGDVLKGSGRSSTIHLKDALDTIRDTSAQSPFVGYGGHAGAAGLSIKKEWLEYFTTAFAAVCGDEGIEEKQIEYDIDIGENPSYYDITEELKQFAPYGEGNPKILFHKTFDTTQGQYRAIGDGTHFMVRMPDITLMGFGLKEKYEAAGMPAKIECVGHIVENWYNNNVSYNFEIVDFHAA